MNTSEASSGASTTGSADSATIDALKRIKLAETEWEEKVAAARRDADAALKRLKEETDTLLSTARTEADTARSHAIDKARTEADAEANTIVREGERAAQKATDGAGKDLAARKSEVLAVVLGGFQGE